MPDPAGVTVLRDIQSQIAVGELVPTEELHVTVLHFGHLNETLKQLQRHNTQLDAPTYEQAVQTFIKRVEPALPPMCTLQIDRICRLGPNGGVIALLLQPDPAIHEAYEHTMQALQRFGENVGIKDIKHLPPQPRALQPPSELLPHISLAKRASAGPVPIVNTAQTIKLTPYSLR